MTCRLIETIMKLWKTSLEVKVRNRTVKSILIDIKKGFLQGDKYSPNGFCCSEMPIEMLLQETGGYKMGPSGNRNVKRTHSLFIDDLKTYQENHVKSYNW